VALAAAPHRAKLRCSDEGGRAQIDAPDRFRALKGQPVVVAVGRLSVEKGFHHLIRVFADLSDSVPGAKLLLVGDGPMMETLHSTCSEEGLAVDDPSPGRAAVLFAGYQEDPVPLVALGRVFAMTSATEGFPNVMIEALAAGLPVVAADTPWGARAVLSADLSSTREPYPTHAPTVSDFGILMPRIDRPEHDDAWVGTIEGILRDPERARGFADRGPERVRHLDISCIGPEWRALIDELCWKSKS
jgi:glycosyltransferase involved in cell wall biosynthesis